MDEAERARKKEILRRIVETLPPETSATIPEWKIDGILDAIEVMEKTSFLMRDVRRAPLPGMTGMIFLDIPEEGQE